MDDRTTTLIDRLRREPVPIHWSDVEARADHAPGVEIDLIRPPRPHATGRRRALAAAAILAVIAAAAAVVDSRHEPVSRVATEPPVVVQPEPEPGKDPVVLPDIGSNRNGAVTVWTGSTYLVWGGQTGGDGSETSTGWRFTPSTGATEPLAAAPLPPTWSPAGVWTGDELIVCCGHAVDSDEAVPASHAAAYNPATNRWRTIAEPPTGALSTVVGSAWTGTEVLVVVQLGNPASYDFSDDGLGLFAYDPATDAWSERAKPTGGDRFGEAVWTGEALVLWFHRAPGTDAGVSYDPSTDTWSDLPLLPTDAPTYEGSVAYAGGQLVAFGGDYNDDTLTIGYRLRPGDDAWRSMAPAPIPPIQWYEGTPGSQTLAASGDGDRVIVYPTNGYERGAGGVAGAPPNLLVYDPAADTWTERDPLGTGPAPFAPDLTVAGELVLWPNLDDPVAQDLSS